MLNSCITLHNCVYFSILLSLPHVLLHAANHSTWSRGNSVFLCAVIFSLHVANCSDFVWKSSIISPQAQFVCCGVFPLPNLTILSLLPAGVLMTGCTPRLQCYPMDFMSLLSSTFAWTSHGCFCLTESKCGSSGWPPKHDPLFLKTWLTVSGCRSWQSAFLCVCL